MAANHLSEAEACLGQLGEQEDDSSVERSLLGRSAAHSLLSIARNLEAVSTRSGAANDSDAALFVAAWAVTAIGSGHGGDTEMIARLVGHARGHRYADAPAIAQYALNTSGGLEHYAVTQAIIALRIELPV